MKIQLNKAHFPVTALGAGRRVGIWFQGCSIGCTDCISRDTWAPSPEKSVDMKEVLKWSEQHIRAGADGITITGGEPFQQSSALLAMLKHLRVLRTDFEFDILCYSGYIFEYIERKFPEFLDLIDALATGPFIKRNAPSPNPLLGSSNQKLNLLSDLAKFRYSPTRYNPSTVESVNHAKIQITVSKTGVWCIGIPKPGDMETLRTRLKNKGIALRGVSWIA